MAKIPIKASLRQQVFKRDNFSCLWCGRSNAEGVKLNADHIIPEAFGGEATIDNLGTLCENCNKSKGPEYFGNYPLTTLFKLGDLDKHIVVEVDHVKNFRISITFYVEMKEVQLYSKEYIPHVESMPDDYWHIGEEEVHYKIKKSEIKRSARIALKEKLRDYLFKNEGYLEELEGRLIFRKGAR